MARSIFAATAAAMLLISTSAVQAAGVGSFTGSFFFSNGDDVGSAQTIQKKRLTSIHLDASFDTSMPTATLSPDGSYEYIYNTSPIFSLGLDGGGTWSDGGIITDTDGSVFQIAASPSGELRVETINDLNVPGDFSAPGVADGTYDIIGFSAEMFVFDRTGFAPGDPNGAAVSSIEVAFFGAYAGDTFGATPPTVFPDVFALNPAFFVAYVSEFPMVGGFPDTANPLGNIEGVGAGEADTYSLSVSEVPVPAALPLLASGFAAMFWAGRRKRKA